MLHNFDCLSAGVEATVGERLVQSPQCAFNHPGRGIVGRDRPHFCVADTLAHLRQHPSWSSGTSSFTVVVF
jgi:hypothetical protein